jgi:hypothetical protein
MRYWVAKVILATFIAGSTIISPSSGMQAANSGQTPNLPMLPVNQSGYFTQISQMTDQWLELDGYGGKKVFRLSDGKPMDGVSLPSTGLSYGNDMLSLTVRGPSGNFPYMEDAQGNRYLPGKVSDCPKINHKLYPMAGCGVNEIYPDGYYVISETQTTTDCKTYRICKTGQDEELWKVTFFDNSNGYSRLGNWLVFGFTSMRAYCIYDIETGRNAINVSFNDKYNRYPKLVGNYMMFGGTVFDTRT